MTLSQDEQARYHRQLLMPEIGAQGQMALKAARILVLGAGGLGSPVLMALTAAGVGHIGICDGDVVDLSNLNRQTLFGMEDLGRKKAIAAEERLRSFNPHTRFDVIDHPMTAENAEGLFANYDLIVEGLDRFAPRYIINRTCLTLGKPWISAAVGRFDGQIAMFDPQAVQSACYGCLVPTAPTDEAQCEVAGVVGTTTAIVGSLAANEAIKALCGMPTLVGHMLIFDGKTGMTRRVRLPKDPNCMHCQLDG
ncbi:MAG: HesA/MoeB/ThiF family protein [Parvularcula sp.]